MQTQLTREEALHNLEKVYNDFNQHKQHLYGLKRTKCGLYAMDINRAYIMVSSEDLVLDSGITLNTGTVLLKLGKRVINSLLTSEPSLAINTEEEILVYVYRSSGVSNQFLKIPLATVTKHTGKFLPLSAVTKEGTSVFPNKREHVTITDEFRVMELFLFSMIKWNSERTNDDMRYSVQLLINGKLSIDSKVLALNGLHWCSRDYIQVKPDMGKVYSIKDVDSFNSEELLCFSTTAKANLFELPEHLADKQDFARLLFNNAPYELLHNISPCSKATLAYVIKLIGIEETERLEALHAKGELTGDAVYSLLNYGSHKTCKKRIG